MRSGSTVECILRRRSAPRYKLRLPVIFRWTDNVEHTEGGFTSDIALDGVLILSRTCPPVGCDVRIQILLPSPSRSDEEIRIECIGKVTRVLDGPGPHGFGVHGVFDDDHLTCRVPS